MELVLVGDARVEVELVEGERKTTLVFLHEGLGCAGTWKDFPQELCRATGCRGVVYSRLGYGASDPARLPRDAGFMHEEALSTLPKVLEACDVDEAIFVGHSDGASIAILYAGGVGKGLRGLVLEAPHVFVEDVCVSSIARLREGFPGSEMEEKLGRRHRDARATFYGWTDVWLSEAFRGWNIEAYLGGVTVPTLVIQGEEDEYGTIAQVDAVCAQVKGASERLILPGVGHSPHRDKPDEVLEVMARFVRKIGV
jgi:pimeloyl-ACP methyl ester carboxylesterase